MLILLPLQRRGPRRGGRFHNPPARAAPARSGRPPRHHDRCGARGGVFAGDRLLRAQQCPRHPRLRRHAPPRGRDGAAPRLCRPGRAPAAAPGPARQEPAHRLSRRSARHQPRGGAGHRGPEPGQPRCRRHSPRRPDPQRCRGGGRDHRRLRRAGRLGAGLHDHLHPRGGGAPRAPPPAHSGAAAQLLQRRSGAPGRGAERDRRRPARRAPLIENGHRRIATITGEAGWRRRRIG